MDADGIGWMRAEALATSMEKLYGLMLVVDSAAHAEVEPEHIGNALEVAEEYLLNIIGALKREMEAGMSGAVSAG